MGNNSFGDLFTITSWRESHGKAIGVVVDGVPAGLKLSKKDIQKELNYRRPGTSNLVSGRKEDDNVEIYSGVFNRYTTGSPILMIIYNKCYDNKPYLNRRFLPRPGHADICYSLKYGNYDFYGGGRSSGRETVGRVAAGAIAKKILSIMNIFTIAYSIQIGSITSKKNINYTYHDILKRKMSSNVYCLDQIDSKKMEAEIKKSISKKDSIGGIVECKIFGLKPGFGDPIFKKLESELAGSLLGIGGIRGFEVGVGFESSKMYGSDYNDKFIIDYKSKKIKTKTNNSGGIVGGVSNGMCITIRVAVRPPSSIKKTQYSVNLNKYEYEKITIDGDHDPCIVLRIIPVIESMVSIVILNSIMRNMTTKINDIVHYYSRL